VKLSVRVSQKRNCPVHFEHASRAADVRPRDDRICSPSTAHRNGLGTTSPSDVWKSVLPRLDRHTFGLCLDTFIARLLLGWELDRCGRESRVQCSSDATGGPWVVDSFRVFVASPYRNHYNTPVGRPRTMSDAYRTRGFTSFFNDRNDTCETTLVPRCYVARERKNEILPVRHRSTRPPRPVRVKSRVASSAGRRETFDSRFSKTEPPPPYIENT